MKLKNTTIADILSDTVSDGSVLEGTETTVLGPDPSRVATLALIKKTIVNHNTRIFRFGLPPGRNLGIPNAKHIRITADVDGREVSRYYTPIDLEQDDGFFDLLIKIYPGTEQYPRGGVLSQYLDKLEIGDDVDFTGPFGRYEYLSNGDFTQRTLRSSGPSTAISGIKYVGLVAAGTGITPIWQMISGIFWNTTDTKEVFLIYGNRREEDILMRKEIEAFQAKFPTRLHVTFTLSQPDENWKGHIGRVGKELLDPIGEFPAPGAETISFICGLPAMSNACRTHLKELGHNGDRICQL